MLRVAATAASWSSPERPSPSPVPGSGTPTTEALRSTQIRMRQRAARGEAATRRRRGKRRLWTRHRLDREADGPTQAARRNRGPPEERAPRLSALGDLRLDPTERDEPWGEARLQDRGQRQRHSPCDQGFHGRDDGGRVPHHSCTAGAQHRWDMGGGTQDSSKRARTRRRRAIRQSHSSSCMDQRDFAHHQRGRAPNVAELHPVLRVTNVECSRA
jgi:hypothetical protein